MLKFLKIFKPKTLVEKLEKKQKRALTEAYRLSKINRRASDLKYSEAIDLADQILKYQEKNNINEKK